MKSGKVPDLAETQINSTCPLLRYNVSFALAKLVKARAYQTTD